MELLLPKPLLVSHEGESSSWDTNDPEWEMRFWPRTIWIDAGTFTGVTVLWFDPIKLLSSNCSTSQAVLAWWSSFVSGPENDQAREILRLVAGLGGESGICVGAESFKVRSTNGSAEFLSSPRIASKIDYALWEGRKDFDGALRRRALQWQAPSDIDMTERGDDRLRALGMYLPGATHRNDATKHAHLHLRRQRNAGIGVFHKLYGWNPDWKGE